MGHVCAVSCVFVEQRAEFVIRPVFPRAELAEHFQNLFGIGECKTHNPIVPNIDEEIGLGGIQVPVSSDSVIWRRQKMTPG